MNAHRYVLPLASFVVVVLLSGCAAFRGGQLSPVTAWPPQPAGAKKSISVVVSGSSVVNEKETEVSPAFLTVWQEQTLEAYRSSGLFSEVKAGTSEADLRAEVRIIDRGEGSMALAFLTGLTLYLIPSSATDEMTVRTTIKDKSGTVLGTFQKTESVTMWQQFFLLFAMPTNFPGTVVKETLYDLSRATIAEARAKGVL